MTASDADYTAAENAVKRQELVVVMWSADGTGKAHLAKPNNAQGKTLCGVRPGFGNRVWTNLTADMCQRCMIAARKQD